MKHRYDYYLAAQNTYDLIFKYGVQTHCMVSSFVPDILSNMVKVLEANENSINVT